MCNRKVDRYDDTDDGLSRGATTWLIQCEAYDSTVHASTGSGTPADVFATNSASFATGSRWVLAYTARRTGHRQNATRNEHPSTDHQYAGRPTPHRLSGDSCHPSVLGQPLHILLQSRRRRRRDRPIKMLTTSRRRISSYSWDRLTPSASAASCDVNSKTSLPDEGRQEVSGLVMQSFYSCITCLARPRDAKVVWA